jgi:hypothetical protein
LGRNKRKKGNVSRSKTTFFMLLVLVFATLLATSAFGLPEIGSDRFQPVTGCGCHSALIDQWSTSMHAKAMTDPLYLLKRDKANAASDGALGVFCDSCHGPVAVMSGEYLDFGNASEQSRQGVGCDFCHQVTGTGSPIGNTSQVVEADGTKRAQFDDSVSPAHETAYSAFHESAEFCGACHNVDHPADPSLHLEATYTEWKEGPYAAEGIVCQDCHMTPGPGVNKPYPGVAAGGGPQREHIYLMTFVGGNVGLGDAELAEERLKAAIEIDMQVPEIVESRTSVPVEVTLTNVGAGHYVPTGLTEVREMWLEVVATSADGSSEVIGERVFGTVLRDAEGNFPVELWEAVAIESDDRIPPRESVTDTFEFTMPASEAVDISATLYYRSCSAEMAAEAGVEIPTTTMSEVTQAVYADEDAKASAIREQEGGEGSSAGMLPWILAAVVVLTAGVVTVLLRRRAAD